MLFNAFIFLSVLFFSTDINHEIVNQYLNQVAIIASSNNSNLDTKSHLSTDIVFNGVLLVAIIATWILKVTSLPKLYYNI